jgi:hypothetical protein
MAEETRAGYMSGWDNVLGHYLTRMKAVIANP